LAGASWTELSEGSLMTAFRNRDDFETGSIFEDEEPRDHLYYLSKRLEEQRWGPQTHGRRHGGREGLNGIDIEKLEPGGPDPTPFVHQAPHTMPPRRWCYRRHYIRQFCSTTIATDGLGKSSLVSVEAVAMTSAKGLLGYKPKRALRCWYINFEDPAEELQRRFLAIMKFYGLNEHDVGDRLSVDSGRNRDLVLANKIGDRVLINEVAFEYLARKISAKKIDVLILDPFASCHRIPENDNIAIDALVRRLSLLADECDCAVELVHHGRKGSVTDSDQPSMDEGRGASSFAAGVRVGRVLRRMTPAEASQAGVENHLEYFRAFSAKANMSPPVAESEWFRLRNADLGNAIADYDSDQVGVVTAWQWPDAFKGITADHLLRVQQAVQAKSCRKDAQAKDWVGLVVAEVLEFNLQDKKDAARVKTLLKTWLTTGALIETDGKDAKGNNRTFVEVGTWASLDS
jgi:hypothetical protein